MTEGDGALPSFMFTFRRDGFKALTMNISKLQNRREVYLAINKIYIYLKGTEQKFTNFLRKREKKSLSLWAPGGKKIFFQFHIYSYVTRVPMAWSSGEAWTYKT